MRALQILRPYRTVILGDWLDCDPFSTHGRSHLDAKTETYRAAEVDPCNRLLDEVQAWSDELIFIEGNHEFRVERFCTGLGELGQDIHDLISPRTLLSAGRRHFTWVPYGDKLSHYEITPDLWAVHGWAHSKHAAARHLDLVRTVSIVHGHTHRQQLHSARDVTSGRVLKAWSPGCLSKLQPVYRHQQPTDWVHGFSLVYVGRDPLDWTEYIVTIENGRCILPDGTEVIGG